MSNVRRRFRRMGPFQALGRRATALLVVAAITALGLLAGTVAPLRAAQQQGPDAFYLALLRDGKSEMLRGDTIAAKKSFRLACFGFLEQPVILAEGLVRLGLAEAALADREAFVATFARLAEVEERFAAYAPAALTPEERRAFEAKALEWVTPELLRSLPTFAPLLARKSAVDLSKLSSRERKRELEKQSAAERAEPSKAKATKETKAPNDTKETKEKAKPRPPQPAAEPTLPPPTAVPAREPAVAPTQAPKSPAGAKPAQGKPTAPTAITSLTPEDERIVADARALLKTVEDRDELRRGFALLRPVADRFPGRYDLQLLAGEIGYRAGLWTAGAEYFKRSTPGGRGPVDPTQRFYYAVCLFEAGDFAGAAEVAASGLEKLQRPPFVESYLQKIRAARP